MNLHQINRECPLPHLFYCDYNYTLLVAILTPQIKDRHFIFFCGNIVVNFKTIKNSRYTKYIQIDRHGWTLPKLTMTVCLYRDVKTSAVVDIRQIKTTSLPNAQTLSVGYNQESGNIFLSQFLYNCLVWRQQTASH